MTDSHVRGGGGPLTDAGLSTDGGTRDRAGDRPSDGAGAEPAASGSGTAGSGTSGNGLNWPRATVHSVDGLRLSVILVRPGDQRGAGNETGADDGMATVDPTHDPGATGLPPVLALHGFASSAAAGWGRTGHLGSLVDAGRIVIAPDLRGHGESERPHEMSRYTLDAVLADIAAVVAAIPGWVPGHRPGAAVDLIGYSLGARLAWTATGRGVVPARRLVLGGFDGRPLFHGSDPEKLDRLAAGAPGNDRAALRALVAGLTRTGLAIAEGDVATPAIPTLIVAGDRDPLASGAQSYAATLPRGSFLSIPGRNHISTVPARAYRQAEAEFLTVLADANGRSLG